MSSSSETGPRCSSPVDSDLSGSDGTKPNPNRELMQNGCSNDKLSYIIPDRYLACAALFTTMHVVMHLLAPALQHLKNHLHNHIASCKHTCMMLRNFINSLLIATCTEKLQTDIFCLSFAACVWSACVARKAPLVASDSSSSSSSESDEEEGKTGSTSSETVTTETITTGAGKETIQLTVDAKNERAVFTRYSFSCIEKKQLLCLVCPPCLAVFHPESFFCPLF